MSLIDCSEWDVTTCDDPECDSEGKAERPCLKVVVRDSSHGCANFHWGCVHTHYVCLVCLRTLTANIEEEYKHFLAGEKK